jgi:hypothetical protein
VGAAAGVLDKPSPFPYKAGDGAADLGAADLDGSSRRGKGSKPNGWLLKEARAVAVVAMAMPVLPGKEQTWHDFVDQLKSPEVRDDYQASRRGVGMTREAVWSQPTPDGRLMAVVLIEADDISAVFGNLATSEDPFTSRFRAFLEEVHGVDIATDPLPEVTMLLDTRF